MSDQKYKIIYADPAWQFNDKASAGERGACHKYSVMSIDDMCALPVAELAADDCLLAMWWVGAMPDEALKLVKAWGFKLKTTKGFTWIKTGREFDSDCIEWEMARDKHGYGRRAYGGKVKFAHRVAWEEKYGPIPPGLCVLHHCDNPSCINTDHLFLGTQADNVADCVAKGRARGGVFHGSAHPRSKLTEEQVTEIKTMCATHTKVEVANHFGVSKSLISQITLGQTRRMELGFPSAQMTVGMGNWTRANTEDCLFATRGRPKRVDAAVHQTIVAERREHSRKPDEARDRLVRLMGDVPRVELFARQKHAGWASWGNEVESDINL